jgi:molybdate transport system permease protein
MFQLDWHPVYLSLLIATESLCLVTLLGIPLSLFMARCNFPGKELVEAFITLPLVLPPVVSGFALLLLLGKNGLVGKFLYEHFALELVFTAQAAAIAATIVAFPLMYQSAKAAFQSIDTTFEDVARTLGANEFRVLYSITLPLAWPGLLSGMVLSYARALGEFGATIMIAGNIPGKTQTIPTAIYFAADANNLEVAGIYVLIISFITFSMIYGINLWSKKHSAMLTSKEKH